VAWLTGLAIALAFAVPETAYLFTWPAIVGSAGVAGGVWLADRGTGWSMMGGAAAAFAAAALWQPDYSLGLGWGRRTHDDGGDAVRARHARRRRAPPPPSPHGPGHHI
jgi:hypothetical protein